MSKIPKPKTLPQPKSLSGTADVKTAAHDALLKLTWSNINVLTDWIYSFSTETIQSEMISHEIRYKTKIMCTIELVDMLSIEYRDDDRGAAYKRLSQRLKIALKFKLPTPKPEDTHPKIYSITLEKVIHEVKRLAHSYRTTDVGFVDIEVKIEAPKELHLKTNLPGWFPYKRIEDDSVNVLKEHLQSRHHQLRTVAEINAIELTRPSWYSSKYDTFVWFDIRTSDVATGQLIRELKTLESYSVGQQTDIFVVMETVEPTVRQMLKNEGFGMVGKDFIDELDGVGA